MKRATAFLFILTAILLLTSACSGAQMSAELKASPTPTPLDLPGGAPDASPVASEVPTAAPTQEQKSNLYDPSIFIIEAAGDWQQEIAPGYFVNYHVELYLDKIDANDNRRTEGSYTGVFYMSAEVDAEDFISDMLSDVPVAAQFDVSGEAVSDNFGIYLNTTDDKAWVDYSILDENGNPLPLTQDTPVARGSFTVMSRNIYLSAHAQGAQGETVDYEDAKASGEAFDINYVFHVQPDDAEASGTRKVTIFMSGESFSHTMEGTLRRVAGYPEDVNDYVNSPEYQNNTTRAKLNGD